MTKTGIAVVLVLALATVSACGPKKPPVAKPTTPPPAGTDPATRPPVPPTPVNEATPVPAEPTGPDELGARVVFINVTESNH